MKSLTKDGIIDLWVYIFRKALHWMISSSKVFVNIKEKNDIVFITNFQVTNINMQTRESTLSIQPKRAFHISLDVHKVSLKIWQLWETFIPHEEIAFWKYYL